MRLSTLCITTTIAVAPLLGAAEIPVYLETTAGSTLTILGRVDASPTVASAPRRGGQSQLWVRGTEGTWAVSENPAYCLAFQEVAGASLTTRPCGDLLVYRDSKRETTRDLKIQPHRNIAVDTSNRDTVLAFYNAQYAINPVPDIGFTGDVAGCNPGTTSPAFRAAVMQRFNFLRDLAGLSDITQDDGLSALAQSSALMQASNGTLSHTPPTTWTCFTDAGNQASAKSNLFQGLNGWDAVTGYINEDGDLGHRRWVLFPGLQRFGTGDIPVTAANPQSYNALYVITGDAPPATPQIRDGFTAWPPKGFVPYKFAFNTWSFSVPGADFSGAAVAVADGTGAAITVNGGSALTNGYGDNTFAFQPVFPNGTRPAPMGADIPVTVTISNVMVNGAAQNYTYTVTLIDVTDPPTDLGANFFGIQSASPSPAGSVFCNLAVTDGSGGAGYTFTLVAGAGSDDNGLFTVNGTTLVNTADLDLVARTSFNVRVHADNGRAGGVIEKAITIKSPFAN